MGFHVFVGYHGDQPLDLKDILPSKASRRLVVVDLDPSSPRSVQNAIKMLTNTLIMKKGLWALVNTGHVLGPSTPCPLYSVQDYFDVLQPNLYGPIEMCRQFLPFLRRAGGRIINVTVTPAITNPVSFTHCPYATSKAGLEGYSDMLRREVYRQGVKVCIVQMDDPIPYSDSAKSSSSNSRDEAEEKMMMRLQQDCDDGVKHQNDREFVQTFLDRCMKQTKGCMSSTSHEDKELAAFTSAVTDRFPRIRYVVGSIESKVFARLFHYLPDWIVDKTLMWRLSKE